MDGGNAAAAVSTDAFANATVATADNDQGKKPSAAAAAASLFKSEISF